MAREKQGIIAPGAPAGNKQPSAWGDPSPQNKKTPTKEEKGPEEYNPDKEMDEAALKVTYQGDEPGSDDNKGSVKDISIVGNTDYLIFFDSHRVDHMVKNFSSSISVDGGIGSANITMLYSPNLHIGRSNYKKMVVDGVEIERADESWGGIQNMTSCRIFVRNMFSGRYCMVFDGVIKAKSVTRSGDGGEINFTAVDHMSWLAKTIVPIAIPLDDMLYFPERLKWKGQGIDVNSVPALANIGELNFRGKNIRQAWMDVRTKAIGRNNLYQKSDAAYFDRPTNRVKQMAEIRKEFTKPNSPLDLLVSTSANSVNSLYVFMNDLVKSMMMEFFQDKDGVIRIKAPYWAQPVLKSHVIDQSLMMSLTESTNWENEYSRVIVTGGLQWYEADLDADTQKFLSPVAIVTTETADSNVSSGSATLNSPAPDKDEKKSTGATTGTWLDSYTIITKQGVKLGGKSHNGVDYKMPVGTNVAHVAGDGKVISTRADNAGSKTVKVMLTSPGKNGWSIEYKHLSSYSVKPGQEIKNGTIVGKSGKTGKNSKDPYLHIGVTNKSGVTQMVASVIESTAIGTYEGSKVAPPDIKVTDGDNLLEPTMFEKKYGPNIMTMDQPMIKFSASEAGGNWDSGKSMLAEYARFMLYYLNSVVNIASLQIVAMPWLRPGFNVWVDPVGVNKIYYITSISYYGDASNGTFMNLGLTMGKLMHRWTRKASSPVDSLNADNEGNVFLSEIVKGYSVKGGDFGEIIGTEPENYWHFRSKMLKLHMGLGGTQHILSKDQLSEMSSHYNAQNLKFLHELYKHGAPPMYRSGDDEGDHVYQYSGQTRKIAKPEDRSKIGQTEEERKAAEGIDNWRSIIKKGHRGNDVKELQQLLKTVNPSLKADGIFGKDTEAALKKFQSLAGLKPDGIVGKDTKTALKTTPGDALKSKDKGLKDNGKGKVKEDFRTNIDIGKWDKNIMLGMRGKQVSELQTYLKGIGYDPGKADGIFGKKTLNAVKKFQRDNKLKADGIMGKRSKAILKEK